MSFCLNKRLIKVLKAKITKFVAFCMASVSISHGNEIIKTLEESLKHLGGIHQFVEENQTVFIKPDLSLPLGPPVTIHPRILGHIVRLCLDSGANEVSIGFNPFDGVSSLNAGTKMAARSAISFSLWGKISGI